MKQKQNTVIVTGATSGIGYAAAKALVGSGFNVIGVGRSVEKCKKIENEINTLKFPGSVRFFTADVSIQENVHLLSEQIMNDLSRSQNDRLLGIVNNVGTFSYWYTLTSDGIEKQWAVNHMAGFLLVHDLLDELVRSPRSVVINVGSDSHYFGRMDWKDPQMHNHYNGLSMYGRTKLANVLFASELNRRYHDRGLKAFVVDPGLVKTEIGFKENPPIVEFIWRLRRSGGTDASVPAGCIRYLICNTDVWESTEIYWKDCNPKQSSKRAMDEKSATLLWDYSELLSGMRKS